MFFVIHKNPFLMHKKGITVSSGIWCRTKSLKKATRIAKECTQNCKDLKWASSHWLAVGSEFSVTTL